MIRSTRHNLTRLNISKRERYLEFLNDYSNYAKTVIEHIWRFGYKDFSIRDKKLDFPKYINYKDFDFIKTNLSARAKSSAATQVSQIIRSCIEKQRRVLWIKDNINKSVKDKKFSKPNVNFVYPNLSSKCCKFIESGGEFMGYLVLKSLGTKYGKIIVPVENFRLNGKIKGGFVLFSNKIQIAWEIPEQEGSGDKVIAIDQGLNSVSTLSDGQVTPEYCKHGHSLNSILDKLSRKKRGSKAFKRAQAHRKNFVNWSINQLNFQGVKEVRLEKVVNIRYRRKSSRKMSHWSNPEIRDKIKRKCEELNVLVVEQSCAYRSQRCSRCGQTRKANRKAKLYECKNCGYCIDADYNASLNHLCDLPDVPKAFLNQRYNLGNGFFWKSEGFTSYDGSELRVPNSQN